MNHNTLPEIAISIATYKRPALLRRLLISLDAASSHPFRVIVVDNDPAESGRLVATESPLNLTYVVEPEPGIVAARNRGLQLLRETDWAVVFVDDDEYVQPGWLDRLVSARNEFSAEIVTGPVISDLPAHTPGWIRRGGFIQRTRFPTGPFTGVPATNNTLVLTAALQQLDPPRFNSAFSATGGSDTELFTRLIESGLTPYWCDEAPVHEEAPAERLTFRWITRRLVRGGNVRGRIEIIRSGRLKVAAGGLARLAYGCTRVVLALVTLRGFHIRDYVYVCQGIGWIGAASGTLVQEYRRTQVGPHGLASRQ